MIWAQLCYINYSYFLYLSNVGLNPFLLTCIFNNLSIICESITTQLYFPSKGNLFFFFLLILWDLSKITCGLCGFVRAMHISVSNPWTIICAYRMNIFAPSPGTIIHDHNLHIFQPLFLLQEPCTSSCHELLPLTLLACTLYIYLYFRDLCL